MPEERCYDSQPIEVVFQVKVFVYGPITEQQVQAICKDSDLQEDVFLALTESIPHGCGLDEITYTIK